MSFRDVPPLDVNDCRLGRPAEVWREVAPRLAAFADLTALNRRPLERYVKGLELEELLEASIDEVGYSIEDAAGNLMQNPDVPVLRKCQETPLRLRDRLRPDARFESPDSRRIRRARTR